MAKSFYCSGCFEAIGPDPVHTSKPHGGLCCGRWWHAVDCADMHAELLHGHSPRAELPGEEEMRRMERAMFGPQ